MPIRSLELTKTETQTVGDVTVACSASVKADVEDDEDPNEVLLGLLDGIDALLHGVPREAVQEPPAPPEADPRS